MEIKDMLSKISRYRFILVLLVLAAISLALFRSASTTASASSSAVVPVIVEFRDDPAAVYKAKSEKAGTTVSGDALKSYRDQLRARQDQFLQALSASGVQYTVKSHDIKNFDGSPAATVQMRYTLVYNGIALSVPSSSIATISAM